jgi:hypothetical protein
LINEQAAADGEKRQGANPLLAGAAPAQGIYMTLASNKRFNAAGGRLLTEATVRLNTPGELGTGLLLGLAGAVKLKSQASVAPGTGQQQHSWSMLRARGQTRSSDSLIQSRRCCCLGAAAVGRELQLSQGPHGISHSSRDAGHRHQLYSVHAKGQ